MHLLDRTVAPNSETHWWKLADKSSSAKTASSSFSLQSKSSVEHNVLGRLGGFRSCWCPIASDLRSLRKVKRESLDEVCSTGIQSIRLQLPYFNTSCEVHFSRERCWADTNSAGELSQTVIPRAARCTGVIVGCADFLPRELECLIMHLRSKTYSIWSFLVVLGLSAVYKPCSTNVMGKQCTRTCTCIPIIE